MSALTLAAEAAADAPFIEQYIALLTDPAHLAVEATIVVVVDIMLGGLLWPRFKSFVIRRHDDSFHDSEHNG